jgi:hypothetical protein
LIIKSILISIIDFSSIIRKRQSRKRACSGYSVAVGKSVRAPLIGSRKRLCSVLPAKLKAAIPVGAARMTRFCFLASVARR